MAVISFNKKIFEKEIGKLDEKLQERISMFGTPVDRITDDSVDIEIFPNRPDLLSYQGFKRSFLAFLGKKTGLKQYKLNPPQKDYSVFVDSSVKDVRPFTVCAIVKGLKFDDEKIKEIIDVQEKLHITLGRKRKKLAIGIYPLEKIVLPITFKALEPDKIKFVPLESEREMSGLEILQRHPAGREYANLLAGKSKFPIFVDSENNILSMPPIINSQLTGKVTFSTKDVFIECSGFEPEILRKCLNIIVTSLSEMGGSVYQVEVVYQKNKPEITPILSPEKMKISIENAEKLLGINLNEKQVKGFLERMEYNYNAKKGEVEVPPWRTDVLHEVDIIEDIAIAYGYENFIPEVPEISTIGSENPKETLNRKISEILSGLGFLEVSNYHLTTRKDQFTKMGLNEKTEKNVIELENSKTEYNIMRGDLSHYALKILSENVDSEYPQKIFETGKIFNLAGSKISEKQNLMLSISPGNFTELKQSLEYLFRMLGLKIEIKESENFPGHFIDGRTAEILFENKKIGYMGEIHPRILSNWKIKMPVALLELNLDDIFDKLI